MDRLENEARRHLNESIKEDNYLQPYMKYQMAVYYFTGLREFAERGCMHSETFSQDEMVKISDIGISMAKRFRDEHELGEIDDEEIDDEEIGEH